jgi:hypothetical protein
VFRHCEICLLGRDSPKNARISSQKADLTEFARAAVQQNGVMGSAPPDDKELT